MDADRSPPVEILGDRSREFEFWARNGELRARSGVRVSAPEAGAVDSFDICVGGAQKGPSYTATELEGSSIKIHNIKGESSAKRLISPNRNQNRLERWLTAPTVDQTRVEKGLTSRARHQTKVEKDIHSKLPRLPSVLTSKHLQGPRLFGAILVSLLLSMVTLGVLSSGSVDKELLIVWRLSLMICCCTVFWTNFLKSTGRLTMFVLIIQGTLLAYFAHHELSPSIGVIVIHLHSHVAAGLLGYALAEYCQRQGIETSYQDIPVPTNSEEVKHLLFLHFVTVLVLAGPMLGVAGGFALLVWYSADWCCGACPDASPPTYMWSCARYHDCDYAPAAGSTDHH